MGGLKLNTKFESNQHMVWQSKLDLKVVFKTNVCLQLSLPNSPIFAQQQLAEYFLAGEKPKFKYLRGILSTRMVGSLELVRGGGGGWNNSIGKSAPGRPHSSNIGSTSNCPNMHCTYNALHSGVHWTCVVANNALQCNGNTGIHHNEQ